MDDVSQDVITRVGRTIAANIAPEELLLYRMYSEAFFRYPERLWHP